MHDIKKLFWNILGFVCLGMAYVGIVTPGIPFSIFLVGAAYSFARGSKRMEDWLYNHRLFGPFLINWEHKKVFPQKAKYLMIAMMLSSLIIMYITLPVKAVIYTAITMAVIAVWTCRFPGSVEEWQRRKDAGEKIGWLK